MLRKKDLAKQFELVVQQEIKNHNAIILSNNQRLLDIQERIFEIKKELKEQVAAINTKIVNEGVYQERKEDINKVYKKKLEQEIYGLRDLFLEFGDDVKKEIKEVKENKVETLSLADLKKIFKKYDDKFLEFEEVLRQIEAKNEAKENKLREEIEKWKSSIRDLANEYMDHRKASSKKVSDLQVDIVGFKKMIASSDRKIYLSEKKIENLYTLIERLNKRLDNESSRPN